MTDRDDLIWLGASLCRAKDRAAAAERRVAELEAAARAYVRAIDLHAGDDYFTAGRRGPRMALDALLRPQDAPEPPTLPDPVPARPEVPGVCWACGGQNPECGVCLSKPDP